MNTARPVRTFLHERGEDIFRTLKTICEIPSPTFHEEQKIRHLLSELTALNLTNVHIDDEGNALGFIVSDPKRKKWTFLTAHADTACEVPVPIRVRDDGEHLFAHGICDNAAGVTALLTFLRFVREQNTPLTQNYLIAFTVGEEGLGAKRGMKAIMRKYGKSVSHVVNVESHDIGRITNACIGQFRASLAVTTKQKGAHSFRNFGEPNAAVILASIIRDLSKLRLPKDATYNITALEGGNSINAIPNAARCLVEFRAKDQKHIDALTKRFGKILRAHGDENVRCTLDILAKTPAAHLPKTHPLFLTAERVQKSLGIKPFFKLGNSDGDVPLALGIPTMTLGASNGFATHSLDEKLEKRTYLLGVEQIIEILLALDKQMLT